MSFRPTISSKSTSTDPPPLATAYAVVPTSDPHQPGASFEHRHQIVQHVTPTSVVRFDDEGDEAEGVDAYRLYNSNNTYNNNKFTPLGGVYRTVNPTLYGHLSEAAGLSWEDDYFEDDAIDNPEDVVAVFDLDYDEMERYWEKVSWTSLGAGILFLPHLAWIAVLGMAPCYLRKNVQWSIRAQHVAITRDGIRFVRERRPTCWGNSCTDAGKSTKTIPFDHITDCSIDEPAGNTCLWIPNTLHTVHVDTASSERSQHELTIVGLKDPVAFKRLVWAMKRHYHPGRPDPLPTRGGATAPTAPVATDATAALSSSSNSVGRALASLSAPHHHNVGAGDDPTVVAELLREIRDELRHNNEALRGLRNRDSPTASASASAPPGTSEDADDVDSKRLR